MTYPFGLEPPRGGAQAVTIEMGLLLAEAEKLEKAADALEKAGDPRLAKEVRAQAEALMEQVETMAVAEGDPPPELGITGGALARASADVVPAVVPDVVPQVQSGYVPPADLQQPTKLESILDAFAGLQVPETPEFLAPPSAPTPRAGTGTVNPQLLQQLMGLLSAGQQPVQPPQTLGQIIGRGRR
jgi:hypothetical protein